MALGHFCTEVNRLIQIIFEKTKKCYLQKEGQDLHNPSLDTVWMIYCLMNGTNVLLGETKN